MPSNEVDTTAAASESVDVVACHRRGFGALAGVPGDAMRYMLSFLRPQDVDSVSAVSRLWREEAMDTRLNVPRRHGDTLLHSAMRRDNWEFAAILLAYGADAHALNLAGEATYETGIVGSQRATLKAALFPPPAIGSSVRTREQSLALPRDVPPSGGSLDR